MSDLNKISVRCPRCRAWVDLTDNVTFEYDFERSEARLTGHQCPKDDDG